MASQRPNIVLIVSDQHRYDWLAVAGHPYVRTPHLDRLAGAGVRFTNTYCSAPLCVPSRMSLLTGRRPSRIGVWRNQDMLGSGVPTLAHSLSLVGYETVLCGRMHFVGPDQRHGFQRRLVGDITASFPGGPSTEFGALEGTSGAGRRSLECSGPGHSPVLAYDDAVTTACERFVREWIEDHSSIAEGERRPLFLTVGFYAPHHPFVCPPSLFAEYEPLVGAPLPAAGSLHPRLRDWHEQYQVQDVSDTVIRRVRAAYAGLCTFADQQVGRVVDAVQALGENTYVIYLSDHGEMAGDQGFFWKRLYYDQAVRVPLIVRGPGVAMGQTCAALSSLEDLVPTACDLAGATSPVVDGQSLGPLLAQPEDDAGDRAIYAELCVGRPERMVRQGPWKLVYYHGYDQVQLFNVEDDPFELHDLGQADEYKAIRKHLLDLVLADWDPEAIETICEQRQDDRRLLSQWAAQAGPRGDLWRPEEEK